MVWKLGVVDDVVKFEKKCVSYLFRRIVTCLLNSFSFLALGDEVQTIGVNRNVSPRGATRVK